MESDKYTVRSKGKKCGVIGLHLAPDMPDFRHGQILLFREGDVEQPLDGTGHPITERERKQDRVEVESIASWARTLVSYSAIDERSRNQLMQFVPECG
ncbi:MAG TPA: hypothetical protein VFE16_00960 [Candidatus Cybelea sp.]|nr:hypothetical protein [Candidatus Cybelea sp.]